MNMAIQGSFFRLFTNCRSILASRPTLVYYQQNVGLKMETRERLKALQIPEKPKKPMTPYFKFVSDRREDLLKKFPNLKVTEVAKKCAEDWKETHNTIKEKYQEEYKTELIEYAKKINDFNLKLSEEQKEFLKSLSKEKQKDKEKRQLKKKLKETHKPKRPIGAYMLFIMDKAKAENIPYKDMLSKCKGKWKELPPSEKQKYQDLYESEKINYENEMLKWEAKMIDEGNIDIIRTSSLTQVKPSRFEHKKEKKE